MTAAEIVALIALCLCFAAALGYLIYRKAAKKGSFDCECCGARKKAERSAGCGPNAAVPHCDGCCARCRAAHDDCNDK